MRRFCFLLLLLLCPALRAQTPTPSPTPERLVRLHSAPPPLEGTISLGIYDHAGKLVRVLHREDTISDFTVGHDGLETTWDGNDDAGHPLPAGEYRAHGYLVGELKIEGVDSFFNDWVTAVDSPHLAHISRIAVSDGSLYLETTLADGKSGQFLLNLATDKLRPTTPQPPSVEPPDQAKLTEAGIDLVAAARGKGGTLWVINRVAKDSPQMEIVQLSAPGEAGPPILRKLAIAQGEPQPVGIAASPNEDRIFLLEESPALQRVRSLTLLATAPAAEKDQTVSDWKIDFTKTIVAHRNFGLVDGKLIAAPNELASAPAKIVQRLKPNPLERDLPGKVTLAAGFDAEGSFLQTGDGLPLRTISDSPNLTRALLARANGDAVDVFQDDGAVVEQFRISNLPEMLAFDCGSFELK